MRWGMAIDLKKCVGCYACQVACKQEHFLPTGIFWSRVVQGESGKYPAVIKLVYPVLCNHCSEAPCVEVCPTGASTIREDGIVEIDGNKCVGCKYCVVACPYQNRSFYSSDDDKREFWPGQGFTELEIIGKELYPLEPDTIVKCTFCAERIDEGLNDGLIPGVDREATPACVNACPAKARYFGNLDDPDSEVSMLIREKRGVGLHPEYETDPSVFYIT